MATKSKLAQAQGSSISEPVALSLKRPASSEVISRPTFELPQLESRLEPRLEPYEKALVRAFQSNLLSLISHELRTPLTGILNALNLLDESMLSLPDPGAGGRGKGGASPSFTPGFSHPELVRMARQNAQRLHRALVTLLDLAALENGTFNAKLIEIELVRMIRSRLEIHASMFRDQELEIIEKDEVPEVSVLGDANRLGRALDLCLEMLIFRTQKGTAVEIRISLSPSPVILFSFELIQGGESQWDTAWSHGVTGFEGGVAQPTFAFAGVLQSEEAFLTRTEEGLGGEFLLIHEVMRLHQGVFKQEREGNRVKLRLEFPSLSSDEAVAAVLASRTYELTSAPSAVALVLIRVPREQSLPDFCSRVKGLLYRVTDGAYPLPDKREVALVLDDYKKSDIGKFIERLEESLQSCSKLAIAFSHCPEDVADPRQLVERARENFSKKKGI